MPINQERPTRFVIPVRTRSIPFNGQDAFRQAFNIKDLFKMEDRDSWQPGSFGSSFRELAIVTENFRNLPLEDLKPVLESIAQKSGERFEFFGTKIPSAELARWGALILLGLQLYFVLHLSTLHTRLSPTDKALNFPWIGLYPEEKSKIVTRVSSWIIPPATVIFLAFRVAMEEKTPGYWVVAFLVVSASAVLAFYTRQAAVELWKIVGDKPEEDPPTPSTEDEEEQDNLPH